MSRKLVSDSFLDYSSLRVSDSDPALHMSTRARLVVKTQNTKEDRSCRRHLDKLTYDERIEKSEFSKTVQAIEREYTELVACKKVFDCYNLQKHDRNRGAGRKDQNWSLYRSVTDISAADHLKNNKRKANLPHLTGCKQTSSIHRTGNVHYSYDLFPSISLNRIRTDRPQTNQQRNPGFSRSLSVESGSTALKRSFQADKNWSHALASVKGILRWKSRLREPKHDMVTDIAAVCEEKSTVMRQCRSVLPGNCKTIYAFKKLLNRDLKSAVESESRRRKVRKTAMLNHRENTVNVDKSTTTLRSDAKFY